MSAYADRVEKGLSGCAHPSFGVCSECPECESEIDEGRFSWRPCGICESSLGGNRYIWHWLDSDGELRHENDGCEDCLIYVSNGEEPENWGSEDDGPEELGEPPVSVQELYEQAHAERRARRGY